MGKKSRLDPGGYAYGELNWASPGQVHRDAPLSRRGRLIWFFVIAVIIVGGITLFAIALISDSSS